MNTEIRHIKTYDVASLSRACLYTKYRHSDGLTHEEAVGKLQELFDAIRIQASMT